MERHHHEVQLYRVRLGNQVLHRLFEAEYERVLFELHKDEYELDRKPDLDFQIQRIHLKFG